MSTHDNSENEVTNKGASQVRSLQHAIDEVRTRKADIQDVVIDLKEAESARLELLASELKPVFDDIDDADERFDLAMTRGDKPRLWIDMTAFVAMGYDKRSYRFHKDTRMGRIVLAETDNMSRIADIVSHYVAEKVVERERMIEGEWQSMKDVERAAAAAVIEEVDAPSPAVEEPAGAAQTAAVTEPVVASATSAATAATAAAVQPGRSGIRGVMWFLLGFVCSLGLLIGAAFLLVPEAF